MRELRSAGVKSKLAALRKVETNVTNIRTHLESVYYDCALST